MERILFYPTLTPEMMDAAGIVVDKYAFSYEYQKNHYPLQAEGSSTIILKDPLEIWTIETEGLIFDKTVRIAYPDLLKGSSGVICQNAELGVGIIWTNKKLTQTGIILPTVDEETPQGRVCQFHHCFKPGTISGDLELLTTAFVKTKATQLIPGEEDLINEVGVTVGSLEQTVIDFNNLFMAFPIEEIKSENAPLWWVEFSEWEDPKTIDLFSRDSLCLFLNPYYDACPVPSTNIELGKTKNVDLLIDILAQTYLLAFQRLSDEELKATKQDVGLANYSVCSVLHQFIENCTEELRWESPEKLLKSLQTNIRIMLNEES